MTGRWSVRLVNRTGGVEEADSPFTLSHILRLSVFTKSVQTFMEGAGGYRAAISARTKRKEASEAAEDACGVQVQLSALALGRFSKRISKFGERCYHHARDWKFEACCAVCSDEIQKLAGCS